MLLVTEPFPTTFQSIPIRLYFPCSFHLTCSFHQAFFPSIKPSIKPTALRFMPQIGISVPILWDHPHPLSGFPSFLSFIRDLHRTSRSILSPASSASSGR
uniref:Uncharacterized protein n=1 Tax=Picea glauca TaxID=3330 RepID=A0A124GN28_PICGL|nr:hypothetical protein ABT39_MTgene5713 [Picea glauca]QHR90639.1 hypothetical protein Q903MT_gene4664 [Picea sitchensis]